MTKFPRIIFLLLIILNSMMAFSQQWGDYTLYSMQNSTNAYLLDTNGNVFHTWTFPSAAKSGYSTYLEPGGTLVRGVSKMGNSFSGGPICGEVQKVDYNGNVTWDFIYSTAAYCSHHDVCPMPNGNVLLIAYELKTAAEVTQAGSTQSIIMWPDKIVEVQPTGLSTGTVVWEWHAWDHLVQNVNPAKDNYQTSVVNHPELLNINYNTQKDWLHMNGVDYNPILDQVTFSSHNLSEIYVIDHSTTTAEAAGHTGGNSGKGGDLLYRWGHPAAYGASGTQILNVVHDAHWIPEGVPNAGRLVGFNNKGVSISQSSIDQIDPPVNGYNYNLTLGSAYLPATFDQRHACNGYSSNMGNSQQLPNGNMLVCVATAGFIYEIDSAGNILWSKTLSGNNAKAFRYEACYVNNPAPAIPVITLNGNDLDAGAANTYQWYLNGTLIPGANSQLYTPLQNGVYVVRITDATGCVYQYSTGYTYPSTAGISSPEFNSRLTLYPNPANGIVNFDDRRFKNDYYQVKVTDILGNTLLEKINTNRLDLSSYPNGVYYLTVNTAEQGNITSRLMLLR
jgi:hypothetical protein